MSEKPKTSHTRLGQLQNKAQAKADIGQASALEAATPELVAQIFAVREESQRLGDEKRVAVELINAEGLTGEYVHRLDSAGLIDHTAPDADTPDAPGEYQAEPEDSAGEDAVLHLYPLADEHGDAMISGNHKGLRILAERLEKALATTSSGGYYMDHGYSDDPAQQLFAADGEGYNLAVERRPGGCHGPSWQKRGEPYFVPRRRSREAGMDV